MDPLSLQSSRAYLRTLVERQHWVVEHGQMLALGLSAEAIKHRVRKRRLRRLWRGVYAVGSREPTQHGWWMAAVLACGEGAVLSHQSAAELWKIRPLARGPIHVSIPVSARRSRRGIAVHRRAPLPQARRRDIPVTTVVDTVIDIAPALTRDELEAAVNEADKRGLVDPERLREALEGVVPRPGVKRLRETLDRRTYVMTDTWLERRLLPIARRAGLPEPETQRHLGGFRIDFLWPELGLVVETDGLTYHRTPAQQAADRRRDQTHTAAGRTPLRFTHGQIRYEPGHVEEVLVAVARRLRAPR